MMIMLLIMMVKFASLVGAPSSVRGAQNLQCSVGKRRRRSAHSWLHTDWGKTAGYTLTGKRQRKHTGEKREEKQTGHTGEKETRTHWGKSRQDTLGKRQ